MQCHFSYCHLFSLLHLMNYIFGLGQIPTPHFILCQIRTPPFILGQILTSGLGQIPTPHFILGLIPTSGLGQIPTSVFGSFSASPIDSPYANNTLYTATVYTDTYSLPTAVLRGVPSKSGEIWKITNFPNKTVITFQQKIFYLLIFLL